MHSRALTLLGATTAASLAVPGCAEESDGCVGEECLTVTEDGESCPVWPTGSQGRPLELELRELGRTELSGQPADLALGDLDGDGHLDAAILDSHTRDVSWLPGDGAGGFDAPQAILLDRQVTGIGSGDLDGDGTDDLLLGLMVASTPDWESLGLARALWGGPDFPETGTALHPPLSFGLAGDLVVADVDGDGLADLGGNHTELGAFVVRGTGGRSFGAGEQATVTDQVLDIQAADLDGDGADELVGASQLLGGWTTYSWRAPGEFSAEVVEANVLSGTRVATADLDGDGAPELLHAGLQDVVRVAWGDGGGDFPVVETYCASLEGRGSSAGTSALDVGDLDGDGRLDVLASNPNTGELAVLGGLHTTRALRLPHTIPVGTSAREVRMADLDGDGLVEVVLLTAEAVVVLEPLVGSGG